MRFKNILLHYRKLFIIGVHFFLVICAYYISFLMRFDFRLPQEYQPTILQTLPILVLVKLSIFGYFGLFTGLWRYASIDDFWKIIKANFFSTTVFIVAVIFIHNTAGYPRSIFLLDAIFCTVFIGGIRFLTRLFREKFRPSIMVKEKKVLIIGAGEAGVMVLRESRNNRLSTIEIVGFIDDDFAKKNLRIQGVKILGTRNNIPAVVKQYSIDELIIAIPSASGEVIRDIISHCQIDNVSIKIIPGFDRMIKGDLVIKPRDILPEDLLGRETVVIDKKEISSYLCGKRVLITGAGGSIGSELSRQIFHFHPKELILMDHNENDLYFLNVDFENTKNGVKLASVIGDVRDVSLLKKTFTRFRPHVVFHAAAHKHVPLMECNPAAAAKNNIFATRNLIYAAHHYKVERFVLISSDKAVNPINVMGASKRISEMVLQAKSKKSKTKFMAVRFGNVLGSAGSVVPLFKRQIEQGGPITITHPDVKRYFMSVKEAVSLVLQAAALGKGGEIFVLDMGQQIKITDIAQNLVTLSGLRLHHDITFKFIGLRPGEKLFEELLLNKEKASVTKHDHIFVSKTHEFDSKLLRTAVKRLEKVVARMDEEEIIKAMKDIICVHEGV